MKSNKNSIKGRINKKTIDIKITFNTVAGFLAKNSKLFCMLWNIFPSSITMLWGTNNKTTDKINKKKFIASNGRERKTSKEERKKKNKKYKMKNKAREKPNLWSFSFK